MKMNVRDRRATVAGNGTAFYPPGRASRIAAHCATSPVHVCWTGFAAGEPRCDAGGAGKLEGALARGTHTGFGITVTGPSGWARTYDASTAPGAAVSGAAAAAPTG